MNVIYKGCTTLTACTLSIFLTACNGTDGKLNVTVTNDKQPVASTTTPVGTSPTLTKPVPSTSLNKMELCQNQNYSFDKIKKIAAGYNEYSVELYKSLTKDLDKRDNVVISPLSISHSLSMVMAGAKGKTLWEIGDLLQLNSIVPQTLNRDDYYASDLLHNDVYQLNGYFNTMSDPKGSLLNIKDALWIADHIDIKKDFKDNALNCHLSLVQNIDYTLPAGEVIAPINHWFSFATGKMAKNTVNKNTIEPTTNTLLTNVAYFKGKWQKPFSVNNTKEEIFFSYRRKQDAIFMSQTNKFKFISGAEINNTMLDVLELPYDDGEQSIFILSSRSSDRHDFERVMTSQNLTQLMDRVSQEKERIITVSIPKFSLNDSNHLAKYLNRQGLRYAFYDGADFSGMTNSANNIDEVVHQVSIIVDEEGGKDKKPTTVFPNPNFRGYAFTANQPFTFVIRDNVTKSIIFIGRYVTPETSS